MAMRTYAALAGLLVPLAVASCTTENITKVTKVIYVTSDAGTSTGTGGEGGRADTSTSSGGGGGGAGGEAPDGGGDAADDRINPACPPKECAAVDPVTCAEAPVANDRNVPCDGGRCVDGECKNECGYNGNCIYELPDSGSMGADWLMWSCWVMDRPPPSPYCINVAGPFCCPPPADGGT